MTDRIDLTDPQNWTAATKDTSALTAAVDRVRQFVETLDAEAGN